MKPFTVQCSYAAYWSINVTVEAQTLEEACEKAIEEANGCGDWRSSDHVGDTFIDAISEGHVVWPSFGGVPEGYREKDLFP